MMGWASRRSSRTWREVENWAAGGFRSGRKLQFLEKDGAELLGGVDAEFAAGVFVDGGAEGVELGGELGGGFLQELGVDLDAVLFDAGEDGDEGHLDVVEEVVEAAIGEVGAEIRGYGEEGGGAIGGGGGEDVGFETGEAESARPFGGGGVQAEPGDD